MKKAADEADEEMLDEYDFSDGVRGKYAQCCAGEVNVVTLEPDVARVFPDSQCVNEALRVFIRMWHREATEIHPGKGPTEET